MLAESDILMLNPELRKRYDSGDMVWSGDYPPGIVLSQMAARSAG